MILSLALGALLRHRARTLLAVLGVAVSAALLLDMVMLATGMRESFRDLLLQRGYQLRVAPKGTLPFDSEATIGGVSAIVAALRANPDVVAVSPVLGTQLRVLRPDSAGGVRSVTTAFALGVDGRVQGDYELLRGANAAPSSTAVANAVVNEAFLQASGARLGDTLDVAAGFDPQLRSYVGRRRVALTGEARFLYTSAGQTVISVPLDVLQALGGSALADRASLVMIKVRDGVNVEQSRRWIERALPRVSAISTESALAQVEQRLSYFRQLAFILGAISLAIGFFLVTTLVTVSVNERIGEIAVLRAIGVRRDRVVRQILVEGFVLSVCGAVLGLGLGLVTARYLNAILGDFPGLPASFQFFVFQPASAWRSLGMLIASGIVAGVYPSWRAASMPIAITLREEAVA